MASMTKNLTHVAALQRYRVLYNVQGGPKSKPQNFLHIFANY